jgi:predicted transposase/invertase (TIGR01784 family)
VIDKAAQAPLVYALFYRQLRDPHGHRDRRSPLLGTRRADVHDIEGRLASQYGSGLASLVSVELIYSIDTGFWRVAMPLGIDPKVDFAFKMMLGNPEHPAVTIHFLNAMLRPAAPVVEVQILNPLLGKERSAAKLVVLDVRARDSQGRIFNIEMQTRLALSFPNRLLYYNCQNYTRQIGKGDRYRDLHPAISLCLLDQRLFLQALAAERWHHSFRLRCDQAPQMVLTEDLEFHIFELPKFRPSSDNISSLSSDEKWLYLFRHAAEQETDLLSEMLGESPYREALGVLKMISKSPEDYSYYEDRLKFLRDEEDKLFTARKEGWQEGRQEGRQEGELIGIHKGLEKGKLAGSIQTLQELLGDAVMSDLELEALDLQQLTSMVVQLQQRLRTRDA